MKIGGHTRGAISTMCTGGVSSMLRAACAERSASRAD